MNKLLIVCLLVFNLNFIISATDNLRSPDVRTLGMASNVVTNSIVYNPSLIAFKNRNELRIDYYNRYSISEMATISGSFYFPNRILPVAFHAASFGFDEYRESMLHLSLGKKLNNWCSLGVGVLYGILESDLFEANASRFSTDIGMVFHPVNNWLIALSITNCVTISLSEQDVDTKHLTPLSMQAGFNWMFTEDMLITGGIAYQEEKDIFMSVGMEYTPFSEFQIRGGVTTKPFRPSLGISYGFSFIMADAVMVYHPVLGISSGIGLSFSF